MSKQDQRHGLQKDFLPILFMFRKEFTSNFFLFQEIDYKKLYLPKNVSLYDSTQIMDSNPIKTAIVVCNKLIREQVLIKIEVGIYFRSMFNWLPWDQDQTNHRIQSEKESVIDCFRFMQSSSVNRRMVSYLQLVCPTQQDSTTFLSLGFLPEIVPSLIR